MGVSIWEGNKAQELIDAINNIKKIDKQQGSENAGKVLVVGSDGMITLQDPTVSNNIKNTLLTCLRHVAWIDGNGKDFYDALENALSGLPVPEYDNAINYLASSGVLLSNAEDFEPTDSIGDLQQSISNGILNVQLPAGTGKSHYIMIRVKPTIYVPADVSKALLKCKCRIRTIAKNREGVGITLTIKSGSTCAGMFTHRTTNDQYYFGVRLSDNTAIDTQKQITLNQWYELELGIENGVQTIKVDGETIYTGAGNTYFGSSGIVFGRNDDATSSLDVDIEWLKIQYS